MERREWRVMLAAGVATGGVVFAVYMLWPRQDPVVPASEPRINTVVAEELATALDALPESGAAAASTQDFQKRIITASAATDLSNSAARRLSALAAETLSMYQQPSWVRYLAYVSRVNGRPFSSPDPEFEETWRIVTSKYAGLKIAAGDIKVMHPSYVYGGRDWTASGGRLTSSRFPVYDGQPGVPTEAMWDVLVPIELGPAAGERQGLRLLLILTYARTPDGDWAPFQAGVYDPAHKTASLPTPWF